MPIKLTATGVETTPIQDIYSQLEQGLLDAFPDADITQDSNPFVQNIKITAPRLDEMQTGFVGAYSQLNIASAIGTALDDLVAFSGIKRKGGSYTTIFLDITTDRSVTLQGLNGAEEPNTNTFIVRSNTGDRYILLEDVSLNVGTTRLLFRAENIGSISPAPNSITTFVTIIPGVTTVNNASGYDSLGALVEPDPVLRARFLQTVEANVNYPGYIASIKSSILNLSGVTHCDIKYTEGDEDPTLGLGEHDIWVIVDGGNNNDIADRILAKKTSCGMKGSISVSRVDFQGVYHVARFDRPTLTDVYIKFDLKSNIAGQVADITAIKEYLSTNLRITIGQDINAGKVSTVAYDAVKAIGGDFDVLNTFVSLDGITWSSIAAAPSVSSKWFITTAKINITQI